jgi:thiamine biosynthesis lipoprotein ApbE
MRQVCEAIVQAQCSWKEYEFMIGGNVEVGNRGEAGRRVVEAFGTVLKETRDFTITVNGMDPRVQALFENWVAGCEQPEAGVQPLAQEQLFQEAWEDQAKWDHWEDFF